MRIVKTRLVEMVPDFRIFLDLDDLARIDDLEKYVEQSRKVLVFVSSGYAQSANAMRELHHSVKMGKGIIALLEPEAKRGRLTVQQMREQLSFSDHTKGVQLADALFAQPPIEWNRIGCFQDVTLRLIAERLLLTQPLKTFVHGDITRTLAKLPPLATVRPGSPMRSTMIARSPQGSLHPRSTLGSGLTSRLEGDDPRGICYHLYCSQHNKGASALSLEVESHFERALYWTDAVEHLSHCTAMLLYLNAQTWTRGDASDSLAAEVQEALQSGVQVVLAHEMPGLNQEGRFAVEFATFFEEGATPTALVAAGVYSALAIPLKGGEWREVSRALLARAISEAVSSVHTLEHRDRFKGLIRRVSIMSRMFTRSTDVQQTSVERAVAGESDEEADDPVTLAVARLRKASSARSDDRYRRSTGGGSLRGTQSKRQLASDRQRRSAAPDAHVEMEMEETRDVARSSGLRGPHASSNTLDLHLGDESSPEIRTRGRSVSEAPVGTARRPAGALTTFNLLNERCGASSRL